jgi:putative IMPACT (imprinted ancient) family translation regulator
MMKELKNFQTIKEPNESRIKEKSSIFIGRAFPIKSTNEAEKILGKVKQEFYDASHHCFAYKLIDGNVKSSDAGEPPGTAGVRILNAIKHFKLNNILLIMVRYFGGTKLGIGPLGKAYYQCAFKILESARKNSQTRI